MAATATISRKQQYKEIDEFCELIRIAMRDAIENDKDLVTVIKTGYHDVKIKGDRFKRTKPNGTSLITINIGPFWTDLE